MKTSSQCKTKFLNFRVCDCIEESHNSDLIQQMHKFLKEIVTMEKERHYLEESLATLEN